MRPPEAPPQPDVTRQPLPALRALQDRLLRETVELAYQAHPYYRAVMRREGIEPRHIQGCDDLVRLPEAAISALVQDGPSDELAGDELAAHRFARQLAPDP